MRTFKEFISESYADHLVWADKADKRGDREAVVRHLKNAKKKRLDGKVLDAERDKTKLMKELLLRKKYGLSD